MSVQVVEVDSEPPDAVLLRQHPLTANLEPVTSCSQDSVGAAGRLTKRPTWRIEARHNGGIVVAEEKSNRFGRRLWLLGGSIVGILGVGVALKGVTVPIIEREIGNVFDFGQNLTGANPVLVENISAWPEPRYVVSDDLFFTNTDDCGAEDWQTVVDAKSTTTGMLFDLRSRRSDVTVTGLTVQVMNEVPLEEDVIANCASGDNVGQDHYAAYLIGESGQISQLHHGAAAPIGNEDFHIRLNVDPLMVYATVEVVGDRLVTWQLVAEYFVDGEKAQITIGEEQVTAGEPPGNTEFSAYETWTEGTRILTRFQRMQESSVS
jgi:hypothetical protein